VDLLEASIPAWPRAILLQCTFAMRARASPELIPCTLSDIGLGICTPYVMAVVMSGVVGAQTSITQSFPRKGRACSRVWRHKRLCYTGALTLSSRGVF
jgi:hypothetical protein